MRLPTSAPLLLAALLLSPTAAVAQKPPDVASRAAGLLYHAIILRHARPADVLAEMHWQESRDAGGAELPSGVVRIFALQSRNILLLQATDAGYKQVQEIVKALDVAPQQVQMAVQFIAVPLSQKLTVDLSDPGQALQQLHDVKAISYPPLQVTTDDGKPVYPSFNSYLEGTFDGKPMYAIGPPSLLLDPAGGVTPSTSQHSEIRLMPRINKDNSVMLNLNDENPTAQVSEALRTVRSDGTAVYDATPFLPPGKYRVFLFVTPTLVNGGTNDGTMNSKP